MPKKKLVKDTASNAITLNTIVFKDMVARARKGASNNSILPITSMMAIELKDNKLTLITTDNTNYLYVIQDKVEGNDFYVTVIADTFAQLIAKTTSENITLELKDNFLEVVGNGKYSIELPTEEGNIIKFPDPRDEEELDPLEDIKLSDVNHIIKSAKASLAVTMENPVYTNYYCGESVLATNEYKICNVDVQLWEEPRLISPQLMDLVALITAEDIAVSAKDDIIMFSTPTCQVYGRTTTGVEDFPADSIKSAVQANFLASCQLKKQEMLQLLDRISLFVSGTDDNEVYITFTKEGLQLSSKASSGIETVKYISSTDFKEFTGVIDIKMLIDQLKALEDEDVVIGYMNEGEDEDTSNTAIKFTEGNVDLLVALLDDDRLGE